MSNLPTIKNKNLSLREVLDWLVFDELDINISERFNKYNEMHYIKNRTNTVNFSTAEINKIFQAKEYFIKEIFPRNLIISGTYFINKQQQSRFKDIFTLNPNLAKGDLDFDWENNWIHIKNTED